VDERSLGVHQVEFVVDSGEDLCDCGRVGDHADSAHDLGEVASGHDGWRLVVDAALEAGWAPVDELDGALGLDGGDRGVDVLWHDITTVHEAAAMYFPWRGSHLVSMEAGSKTELVISETESCSW